MKMSVKIINTLCMIFSDLSLYDELHRIRRRGSISAERVTVTRSMFSEMANFLKGQEKHLVVTSHKSFVPT